MQLDNKENIASIDQKPTTDEPQKQNQIGDKVQEKEELKSDLIVIGSKQNDLKANFERFRKQKKEQIKYRKYVADQIENVDRKNPEVKQRLREKFVETAKKYFGVPYAQRYWKPDEQHYNAPIFLDCCALVKQIVYDMREDLGFTLDRWNQAYQFDTLPVKLEFEELKPGDLIFYSGTYYNTKLRAQKHDMVHVEIYTGGPTGEQSIGSRWQRGLIGYFDSFKFTSTSYHSIQFHYRSIDTWLEGICKSHCDIHQWKSQKCQWAPGKNSIFNLEDEYDENDMGAVGEEEGEEGKEETQPVDQKMCYVGLGNNQAIVKDSLIERGYKEMSRGMQFSDKYRFRWVQTVGEVNFMKFKEGIHLVNHISNAKIFTNKISTLETLEELKIALEKGTFKSDMTLAQFFPATYRLDIVSDLVSFLHSPSEGLWLVKKSQSNQGKGISLVSDIAKYKDELLTMKKDDQDSTQILMDKLQSMGIEEEEKKVVQPKQKWSSLNNLVKELDQVVVQKYIHNPLLIEGRKFDIRAFMIVSCMKPYLVLFQEGYVRLCLNKYTTENFENDKITHLTNNSVQKKHPQYKQLKESSIMSIDQLVDALIQEGKLGSKEEFKNKTLSKIKEIMKLVFLTVKNKLDRKFGCFELFGFDLLLDDQMNPHLIEINTNPALFTDTKVQKDLLPLLVSDIVESTIQMHPYGQTEGKTQVAEFLEKGIKEMKLDYEIIYQD